MNDNNLYIKVSGYIISLIFLYLTFIDTEFNIIINYLNIINIYFLISALLLTICFYATRAFYQINNLYFIKPDIPFLISFSSIGIAQFYNVIFPARLGEVIRTYFLSNKQGLRKATVLSYIFLEKIMDILVILFLLLLIIYLNIISIDLLNPLFYFSIIIILIILLLIIYYRFNNFLLLLVDNLFPKSIYELIYNINHQVLDGLRFFKTGGQVLVSILLLLLSWVIMLGVFWLVSYPYVKLFGMPYYSCLVFMVFSVLSLSVPSAPAGIGVMHYGLFLAVKILLGGNIVGSQINLVAAFVISMHFSLILLDLLTGGGVLIYAKFSRKKYNFVSM